MKVKKRTFRYVDKPDPLEIASKNLGTSLYPHDVKRFGYEMK